MTPPDLEVNIDITEEEYEELKGKYITIPPGVDGIEREGDSIYLAVEAGMADWKQTGVSFIIPLVVTEPGINNGKQTEWYMAISKTAMGINKAAAQAFGVEDEVMKRKDGKIVFNPSGFAGASAMAKFRRELSNKGNMRSVLDSTAFMLIGTRPASKAEDII